jgi:hypothetical protein
MPITWIRCERPRNSLPSSLGFSLATMQQTLLEPTSSTVRVPDRRDAASP